MRDTKILWPRERAELRASSRKFVPVFVTENMVGHKLGDFAPTRTFHGHQGAKKSKVGGAPKPPPAK